MTRAIWIFVLALAAALTLLAAAGGGWLGALSVVSAVVAVVGYRWTSYAYRRPASQRLRHGTRRPLTEPLSATLASDDALIRRSLANARWADADLRPSLRRITDALLLARGASPSGSSATSEAIGPKLSEFLDPRRHARGHDDPHPPTLADLDEMLSDLERLSWH